MNSILILNVKILSQFDMIIVTRKKLRVHGDNLDFHKGADFSYNAVIYRVMDSDIDYYYSKCGPQLVIKSSFVNKRSGIGSNCKIRWFYTTRIRYRDNIYSQ